jgi:hypothetical protein
VLLDLRSLRRAETRSYAPEHTAPCRDSLRVLLDLRFLRRAEIRCPRNYVMLGLTVPRVTVRASTRHHSRPVLNAAGPRFGLPSRRLLLAHACAAPEQRVARTAEPEVAVPLTRPCIARQEASCLTSLLFYHTLNQSPFRYSTDKVACSCTPCVVSCCARTARAIGKCGWGWCDSCFITRLIGPYRS